MSRASNSAQSRTRLNLTVTHIDTQRKQTNTTTFLQFENTLPHSSTNRLDNQTFSRRTVVHTRCLPVIIIHAFKPTRFKSEQQWSWRPCVTLARRPTSIDCLRLVFDWSKRFLAISNALTVDQVIQNGLLSPMALSFALNVPVDTEVLVFRYVALSRTLSNLVTCDILRAYI